MAILLASVASVAFVGTAYAQTSSVTVGTDEDSYTTGDDITISGTVTNVQTGQQVLIRVFNPLNALARTDPVAVAADGSWTYTFPSGGPLMRESGDYRVIAGYRGVSEETTFAFVATDSWRPWTVNIGGNPYVIRYQITGGSLQTVAADVELSTMAFGISTTGNGTLKLQLPRAVMQALTVEGMPTGGTDVDYVAFADGIEADIEEATSPAAGTRELSIDFEAGTEDIEVVGTWIVPEFGAIAAIVLAVAIVGIIVATARYGKLNSFLPRL
ncbi:MAG TPA: PEFG-CTERM sorting domain-containing protein [Nitrososphaera sp.]